MIRGEETTREQDQIIEEAELAVSIPIIAALLEIIQDLDNQLAKAREN